MEFPERFSKARPGARQSDEASSYSTGTKTKEPEYIKQQKGRLKSLALEDEQADGIEAFRSEVMKGEEDGFFVSVDWLYNLKEHEQQDLMSELWNMGYSEISTTTSTILFAKIENDEEHHTIMKTKGPVVESLSCSRDCDEAGAGKGGDNSTGRAESSTERRTEKFKGKLSPTTDLDEDEGTQESNVASTSDTSGIRRETSKCYPLLLTVACSSTSATRTELQPNGNDRREQFGDLVVTMPMTEREKVPTTTDGCFVIKMFAFRDGKGTEVPVNMNATARTSLGCCVQPDLGPPKVRIKFFELHGEVKDKDSNEPVCNYLVLSSLCTNVYCCVKRRDTQDLEEIDLKFEDEYYSHPRVVSQPTGGTTSLGSLVWLAISEGRPKICESVSKAIELTCDVKRRRDADLEGEVHRAHVLHFENDLRPVMFDGNIDVLEPQSFLEIHIRYQFTIIGNDIARKGRSTYKVVDFDICLETSTENIALQGSQINDVYAP